MAGNSSAFPCLCATTTAVQPSFNVVQRLHMRQLRGHLRPTAHSYPVCRSLFGKIPGRLGVPLKQIVDANALHEEGHVFLGFSKDGKFVLSYTLNVNADDHTAYPVYVYKLYWWRFRDNQPMQKVSEVRLFGEKEDIQQDLYLAVCTWPTDASKVLVYGCCTNSKAEQEDEKLLCYVTITGVPSNNPCEKCLHYKYSIERISDGFPGPVWTPPELLEDLSITDPAPHNCLQHGFAVHTKFELSPPFPSFSPKHSLAKDGVAVLNTGDSIIALNVSIGEEKSLCGSLYSPLHSRSSASTQHHSNDYIPYCTNSESSGSQLASKLTRTQTFQSGKCSQTFNNGTSETNRETSGHDLLSLCDQANDKFQDELFHHQRLESFSRKYCEHVIDQVTTMSCDKGTVSPPMGMTQNSKESNSNKSCQRDDGIKQKYQSVNEVQKQVDCKRKCSVQGHELHHDALNTQHMQSETNLNSTIKSINSTCSSGDRLTSEILSTGLQGDALHGLQERTRIDERRNWFLDPDDSKIGCGILHQCPYHHASEDISSTQHSVCTIQECTCKLQGFTYSVRYYKEQYGNIGQTDEIEANEYDSMLPVVVCGTQTQPMVTTKRTSINEGPFIEVKQLTMDAEHYICDTIRTCAPWGRRYIAFTDYDMQILEVCPNSSCVIVMILALIRAWPQPKQTQDIFEFDDGTTRTTPKVYQTGFKFTWNLKTGKQTTFEVNELVEFDQSQLRKKWNPGRAICQDLQKKCNIPQGHARGVYVLTNEAVFKNKSLKRLLDSEHYVAIVLT